MIDPNHLKTRFLKKIGVQSPTNFLKTPLEIRVEQKFKILATLEKTNFKRKKGVQSPTNSSKTSLEIRVEQNFD